MNIFYKAFIAFLSWLNGPADVYREDEWVHYDELKYKEYQEMQW